MCDSCTRGAHNEQLLHFGHMRCGIDERVNRLLQVGWQQPGNRFSHKKDPSGIAILVLVRTNGCSAGNGAVWYRARATAWYVRGPTAAAWESAGICGRERATGRKVRPGGLSLLIQENADSR